MHNQVLSRTADGRVIRRETHVYPDMRVRATVTRDAQGRFVKVSALLVAKDK